MKTEIYKLSASELSNAYENKVLSPVEVTNSIIDRIKDIDDKLFHRRFHDKSFSFFFSFDAYSRFHSLHFVSFSLSSPFFFVILFFLFLFLVEIFLILLL